MASTFCSGCGNSLPPDARFCAGCGRAVSGAAPPSPESPVILPFTTSAPRSPRSRRRIALGVVVPVAAAVVALVLLGAVPISHSYKFDLTSTGTTATESRTYPAGTSVNLHWEANKGAPAEVIVAQGTTILYDNSGTSGSYAFTANANPYTYTAEGTSGGFFTFYTPDVGIWGTWSAPLL